MCFFTTTLNFAWLVYMNKVGVRIIVAPTVAPLSICITSCWSCSSAVAIVQYSIVHIYWSHVSKWHVKFVVSHPLNAAQGSSAHGQRLREHCPRFPCWNILQCWWPTTVWDKWWEVWHIPYSFRDVDGLLLASAQNTEYKAPSSFTSQEVPGPGNFIQINHDVIYS